MIEFFFDCSSPWTYLGFHHIQPLAAELKAEIQWRPILVGGVFNSVNPSVYASRDNPVPAKAAYLKKDLHDWARLSNLAIRFPPTVFPVNSVKAMRGCILLEPQGKLVPFARAVFEAYWGDDQDISQDAVLEKICTRAGIDAAAFFSGIVRQDIKDRLKANTEELIRRGGFGSPTLFVNGEDMYFGNDRLPLVRDALLRGRHTQTGGKHAEGKHTREPLLLMGAPASPYTRKMLAVLRYRRIAHALIIRGSARLATLPAPKVELLPTFYLPNAAGEIEAVTDSTPLITRFEADYPTRHVRPADPVVRFLDSLLEDYADEWLTKAMFHYRWSFAPDIAKAGNILPRWRDLNASEESAAEHTAKFSKRQIDRLRFVGSSPATAGLIEESYVRFLAAFEAHLRTQAFLMGARPGAADFAAFGQLTQLAGFDPTPTAIALAHAPRVTAWVGLVEDLSGLEPTDGQWVGRDAIPASLRAVLAEAGRVYVPVMLANARAVIKKAERVECDVDGRPWTQNPFPYQAKCLRWLREEFSALSAEDASMTMQILQSTGCAALIEANL